MCNCLFSCFSCDCCVDKQAAIDLTNLVINQIKKDLSFLNPPFLVVPLHTEWNVNSAFDFDNHEKKLTAILIKKMKSLLKKHAKKLAGTTPSTLPLLNSSQDYLGKTLGRLIACKCLHIFFEYPEITLCEKDLSLSLPYLTISTEMKDTIRKKFYDPINNFHTKNKIEHEILSKKLFKKLFDIVNNSNLINEHIENIHKKISLNPETSTDYYQQMQKSEEKNILLFR